MAVPLSFTYYCTNVINPYSKQENCLKVGNRAGVLQTHVQCRSVKNKKPGEPIKSTYTAVAEVAWVPGWCASGGVPGSGYRACGILAMGTRACRYL